MPPFKPALERFHEKYEVVPSGCWMWSGMRYRNGYAGLWDGKKNVLAHRFAHMHLIGPIPEGVEIDHTCNERACVNPAHFELVDHAENRRRSRERKLTCTNGHAFDEANTYWFRGNRYCRKCRNENEKRSYRKRVAGEAEAPPA